MVMEMVLMLGMMLMMISMMPVTMVMTMTMISHFGRYSPRRNLPAKSLFFSVGFRHGAAAELAKLLPF